MLSLATLIVFPALMAFAAASDLVTMTISNSISLLLVGVFLVLALAIGLPLETLAYHFGVSLAVLAVTFLMFAAGWIGGGDAKLAAATALWLGPSVLMDYLLYAAIFGGVLTLLVLAFRREPLPSFVASWAWLYRLHDARGGVPYGIALAASALLVYPAAPLWQAVCAA